MRTTKSIQNSAMGLICYAITALLFLLTRSVIMRTMGSAFLGRESVVLNLAVFLHLFVFLLLERAVQKQAGAAKEDDRSWLIGVQRSFQLIGIALLFIGGAIGMLLTHVLKEEAYLGFYFLFYVAEILSPYLWLPKRFTLVIHHREDVLYVYRLMFQSVGYLLACLMLLVFHSFVAALTVKLSCSLGEAVMISRHADYKYSKTTLPWQPAKTVLHHLDQEKRQGIWTLMLISVGCLLVSRYVGAEAAGSYLTYLLVLAVGIGLISSISEGASEYFGEFMHACFSRQRREKQAFLRLIRFCLVSSLAVWLWFILKAAAPLWLGQTASLSWAERLLMVVYFYVLGMWISGKQLTRQWQNIGRLFFWQGVMACIFMAIWTPVWGALGAIFGMLLAQIILMVWEKRQSYMAQKMKGIQDIGMHFLFAGLLLGLCLLCDRLVAWIPLLELGGVLIKVLTIIILPLMVNILVTGLFGAGRPVWVMLTNRLSRENKWKG